MNNTNDGMADLKPRSPAGRLVQWSNGSMNARRVVVRLGVALVLLVTAGCTGGVVPTFPTPNRTTIFFSNRLHVGGFLWRSFRVERFGQATVQLVAMSPETDVVVGLGLGRFDGTNCNLLDNIQTAPNETDPQILRSLSAGEYCVRITDIGNLTKIADFSIIIVIP